MNKKNLLLALVACVGFINTTFSQTEAVNVKYRRSSLHTIIVESENFPRKDVVLKAYQNAPFPDKYNDHSIGDKSFDPAKYPLTAEEKSGLYKSSKMGKLAASTGEVTIDSVNRELSVRIEKYLAQEKIANKLIAKWFNRQDDGSFDMNLIGERGSYDATEMQANIAKGSARGVSSLADAGEELIGNTFVVINKMNFVENEPAARIARDIAKSQANGIKLPVAQQAALKAADETYEKSKEGYSVWATAFLYKLSWNDSISAVFYNDLWINKGTSDAARKEAFDKANFNLEFVGDEKATGLVLFSLKETRTEDQIIELATVRTIDAVYAKLQKKYDVFKTKTPILGVDPITAKIGMKEGLEGGESFEILEQSIDPKTGMTVYNSKGKITVDKDLIWDNRYNAGDGPVEGTPAPTLDRTTFKGGKKLYPGLLIRQTK